VFPFTWCGMSAFQDLAYDEINHLDVNLDPVLEKLVRGGLHSKIMHIRIVELEIAGKYHPVRNEKVRRTAG